MLTLETDGKTNRVQLLDDTGNDEDVTLYWETGGAVFILDQQFDDADNMQVTLTPLQAAMLRDVLNSVIIESI